MAKKVIIANRCKFCNMNITENQIGNGEFMSHLVWIHGSEPDVLNIEEKDLHDFVIKK